MKLLIGGDLVPTQSNSAYFEAGDAAYLLGQGLVTLLSGADYRVFNLEVPLTDVVSPVDKCGPNLIASTATVAGFKAIGANFVTLANNHILDQGEQGLISTTEVLAQAGIAYAGAGKSLLETNKPHIVDLDVKRVGIYCCAEHEFSIATPYSAGANPFDPLESLDHIAELKQQTDYVIVLHHGGKEHYRYPSPNLQKVCRKMVEKGADLVVCQHSHCIGCEEQWQGGTIVYGQGNFLFDHSESKFWQTSLLIELSVEDGVMLTYHPLKKQGNTVCLAQGAEAKKILSDFHDRSAEIQEDGVLERKCQSFSEEMFWSYMAALHGKKTKKLWFRIIDKLSGRRFTKWYLNRQYDRQALLRIQNYVECEAHRELLIDGIKLR